MAVIVGMKPADISDFTPTELPIDEMAKGLIATQKRADEVKNTIALGDSALAIETRPFELDIKTAEQIQNDYKTDVNKLIVDAGGDFAKIDNSQIQSLATKYATDERVRMLTSAKKEFDVANSLARKIRETNGTELFFGSTDPRKQGLYDENGNWLNFSGWDIQTQLDWVDDAASLYKDLGFELKKEYGFDEKSKFANWKQFYQWEVITSEKWNSDRIQDIKDQAVFLYDKKNGGKQYRRTRAQELKNVNPNYSDEEIKKIIDDEVYQLVFTLGEAREEKQTIESIDLPPVTSTGRGSTPTKIIKPTDKGKEVTVTPVINQGVQTVHGYEFGNGTFDDYIQQLRTDKPIIPNLQEFANNPSGVENKEALRMAMTAVNPNIKPSEKGDKIYVQGSLMALDNTYSLTGSKNRSMFRISTTPKQIKFGMPGYETVIQGDPTKLADDESIMDIDDYAKAYSQINNVNPQIAKNNLLGSSEADGYSSMFDFKYDDIEKRHKMILNPVITKVVENLEKETKDESLSKENREYAKNKLNRIKEKINQSASFQNDHKEKLEEYTNYFNKADQKIKNLEKIQLTALNDAGLSKEELDQLQVPDKKTNKSNFDLSKNIYTKAKLKAQDDYWKSNFSSNSYQYSAYPGPLSVLNQLSGGKEVIAMGAPTVMGTAPTTRYSLDDGKINQSLIKINSDPNIQAAWNFYTDFYTNALQQDISINDIKNTIGEAEYQNLVSSGKSNEIFKRFATKKINAILKDTDKINYSKERTVLINNISEIGKSVVNHDKKEFKTLTYDVSDSYYDIQQKIMNSTTEEVKKQALGSKLPISDKLIKYFNNVDEEMKKNYDVNYVFYSLPGETKESDKSLSYRTVNKAWNVISNGVFPVTRLLYNETDTEGKKQALREEYNIQDVLENIDMMIRSKEGENAKIDFNKRREYMNEALIGINMDVDNKYTSYTADFTLYDYKNGSLKPITIQVPINPDPSDLVEFGIIPLEAQYMNLAKQSFQQNNNAFFVLEYENNPKLKTTVFRSAFDVSGTDIKKGEYYVYDDVNGRSVPRKLGTFKAAVGEHLDKIFSGINMTTYQQVNAMIQEIERVSDPRKKNEILTTKYLFNKDYDAATNIRSLYAMRDKLLLKNPTPESTTSENIEQFEEEEEGK